MLGVRLPHADRVADPHLRQAPHLRDLSRCHRGPANRLAVVEHVDRGDLPLGIRPEPKSISDGHGSREHANVRDLLAGPPALDLEDAAGDRAVDVPFAGRQKLRDACHQRIDARAGDRRAEEHRMH